MAIELKSVLVPHPMGRGYY